VIYQDNVSLNSDESVATYNFSGIEKVHPKFGTQFQTAAGVWGIGNPSRLSFLESYTKANGLPNMFSFCLQQNGGWLTVGGINSSFVGGNITYLRILGLPIDAQVDSLNFNGKEIFPHSNWTFLFDSGTNVTLLDGQQYDAYYSLFNATCATKDLVGICGIPRSQSLFSGACFNMTDDEVAIFPNISFTISRVEQVIQPQYYLFAYNGQRCLGMADAEGELPIIGDTWMRPFVTIMDYSTHPKRLGFAPGTTLCTGGGDQLMIENSSILKTSI